MKRRQSSCGSMGKDKVAVKDAGRTVAKTVPGKKTEPDNTPDRSHMKRSAVARKIANRQL